MLLGETEGFKTAFDFDDNENLFRLFTQQKCSNWNCISLMAFIHKILKAWNFIHVILMSETWILHQNEKKVYHSRGYPKRCVSNIIVAIYLFS